jgi:transposase
MRYELTDYEWAAISPMLPNKPRGVPRLNDLAARLRASPDRDMLQRLLVARSRDEVALQPPSYLAWFEQPPFHTECTRKFLRSAC